MTPGAVAIDATLWDEPTTGIGLYTRQLTAALERQGWPVLRLGATTSGDAPRGSLGRSAWTLGPLSEAFRDHGVGLYHAFGNFNLPLVRPPETRFVLTVHDVIPDLLPETASFAFRTQFRVWLGRSVRIADRIVCVSETTRKDLAERFRVPREKMVVIHNGVDHVDTSRPSQDDRGVLRGLDLPPSFFLFAGSWDARKNVLQVLESWSRLPENGRLPLVLVGQPWFGSGPAEKRVAELQARGAPVRTLGFQNGPVLYEIMRRATVFVFPSFYEGFGLPPLEAMRLGTPTIISDRGALPEVCGEAALRVAPDETEALRMAMARLAADPAEREARSVAGRIQAQGFTWDAAAKGVVAVYAELMGIQSA
jgi:glycosyltransferase involved in cell wall biosynthesis